MTRTAWIGVIIAVAVVLVAALAIRLSTPTTFAQQTSAGSPTPVGKMGP